MSSNKYEKTELPRGIESIFEICEVLRDRNKDGWVAGAGGHLAKIKGDTVKLKTATTCSPFTGTVIGVAFDKEKFPRDDWPGFDEGKSGADGDPYVPSFDGGTRPLPFSDFYKMHNDRDAPVQAIVEYNLGWEIPRKELWRIRRGDLIAIDWYPIKKVKKGDKEVGKYSGGHVVFCWDVHTDKEGHTDCIQLIGSNGSPPAGYGVSIVGCYGKKWFDGSLPTKSTLGTGSLAKNSDWVKKKGKYFVLDDEIVSSGTWFVLPGVKKEDINLKTFRARVPLDHILPSDRNHFGFGIVRAGRFHYKGDPPKPYSMKEEDAPSKEPDPPGHAPAKVTVVTGTNVKNNPETPKKVTPSPAKQEDKKPLNWQHYVEQALQQFYQAKWIKSNPGNSDDINDSNSQAAIKEFQTTFHLKVDGIVGPETRGAIAKQLPACQQQVSAQILLGSLYRGKKLTHDPGPPDGVNNPQTSDAVKDFQSLNGLEDTGIPDAATLAKINEVYDSFKATPEKPGLEPEVRHLYWVGSPVDVGGPAKLRLHSRDLIAGQECPIHLKDGTNGKELDASVKLKIESDEAEVSVPIPTEFSVGAKVYARVVADLADEGTLEANTGVPLEIRSSGFPVTETADWRPSIGKDEVPQDVLDIIRRNRARYPKKDLPVVTEGPYAATADDPLHYDYKPGASHEKWAKSWVQKKIDAVGPGDQRVLSHIASAFMRMLQHEGLPASLQTYDNQIVTWGVGLGAKGDGKEAFTHLNKDPKMKKLLDDLGINFDKSTVAYQVVHLDKKKVISSRAPIKEKKENLGTDLRHIVALQAWREQPDLLSAIIGISEDPATRDAVMESQWAVYLSNSTRWTGQDKVFSLSLFFMITHMFHWLPAIGNGGVYVHREFEAVGGGTPSFETDQKIAPRIIRSCIAYAKIYAETPYAKANGFNYKHVRAITRDHVWRDFRSEAKKEGFDPGALALDPE